MTSRELSIAEHWNIALLTRKTKSKFAGSFPVELTPTTILLPHSSYPHNPLIAHVLYQTTYLDKWGTGVERIVQLCNNANIPTPFYTIANRSVILTIPRVTYRVEHVNEQQVGSKLAVSWQQVGSKKSTNYTTNYTTNTKIHIPMLSISNLPRIWF